MPQEGVIKFNLRYTCSPPGTIPVPEALNRWRHRLWHLQLIGRRTDRYDSAGYGNVSRRIDYGGTDETPRRFVVSGSQTGSLAQLDARHYCLVTDWDVRQNRVTAHGPIEPSSEALTHGMLYDQAADIHVVFHVHSPAIWQAAERLDLPATDQRVAYGTPDMASEVARLLAETDVGVRGIFIMGGHEEGVIAFGRDEEAAGRVLLNALERSLKR